MAPPSAAAKIKPRSMVALTLALGVGLFGALLGGVFLLAFIVYHLLHFTVRAPFTVILKGTNMRSW